VKGLLLLTFFIGLIETPLILLEPVPLKVIVDSVLGNEPLPGPLGGMFPPGPEGYGGSLLLAAVIETESGFNPEAVSIDGAVGLMQIMPATADLFGVAEYGDAVVNIDVGTRYLSFLIDSYDGDIELALAAYNAGPGNVSRFSGVPPFGETQRYVEQVLGRYVDHHQRLWNEVGGAASLVPGSPIGS